MFAEVMPFDKDAYLARKARLGVASQPRPVPRAPREVIQVSEERRVYVPAPQPAPDPKIIPDLDESLLVPADQWKIIFHEVCEKHQVAPVLIRGKQRAPYIVKARRELTYRLSQETGMSLPQIASKIGYGDHSVILYNIRKYKEEHGL